MLSILLKKLNSSIPASNLMLQIYFIFFKQELEFLGTFFGI